MTLTTNQTHQFESQGFLSGVEVVDPKGADTIRKDFNSFEVRVGRDRVQTAPVNLHFEEEFAWNLATNQTVLDCAESLLGPNLLLLGTRTFCKYGPSEDFVAWHQDLKYWGLDPAVAVNAWIAIDDCDADNGCLRYIPGSHKWESREHGKAEKKGNLLSINQELPLSTEEEETAVDIALQAGQISMHHGMMTHGSRPNLSNRRRCGMAMVYVPAEVKPAEGADVVWTVVLVRGEAEEIHFDHRSNPFK